MQLQRRFLCRDAISIVPERTDSKRIMPNTFEQIAKGDLEGSLLVLNNI